MSEYEDDNLSFDDDLGMIEVVIKSNGEEVSVRLDALVAHDNLYTIAKRFKGQSDEAFWDAARDYMETLGFPRVSALTAEKFIDHVSNVVKRVKKKAGLLPASSDSTA